MYYNIITFSHSNFPRHALLTQLAYTQWSNIINKMHQQINYPNYIQHHYHLIKKKIVGAGHESIPTNYPSFARIIPVRESGYPGFVRKNTRPADSEAA